MDNDYNSGAVGATFGILIAVILAVFYLVIFLGAYALSSWLLSQVFRKVGIPRWKAWVPFYGSWVFLELGGQPGWLAILTVIPVANIVTSVFLCIAAYNIGLAFGKEGAWVLLYIFLSPVWVGIVGFDASRWEPWRSPVAPIYGPNIPYPTTAPPPPRAAPGY